MYGKQIRPLLNGLEFQLKEGAITDFMRPPDSGEESLTQSQIPEWLPQEGKKLPIRFAVGERKP